VTCTIGPKSKNYTPRMDEGVGVAILNGFGRSLGDGIIGLQALSLALAQGSIPAHPVLFRLPGLSPLLEQLYAVAEFAEVRTLPWSDETPARPFALKKNFSRTIELRDFAFDPNFRACSMIDFFLTRLGVDPASVPPDRKRNTWLHSRVHPALPANVVRGYILVCPRASMALRSMPHSIETAIRIWLEGHTNRTVLIQPHAESIQALCGQVAGAALVISTDTAMVHICDAFSVPCLAFFTTHHPEWRVRDYPLCRAVYLRADLPPALEFARSDADLAAARAAWFPRGENLSWLYAALDSALHDLEA